MKTRGFTLIELLVVIAIIGILAGIVIVSLTSAQERGARASALSSLRSIIPTIMTCSISGGTVVNGGVTPTASNPICYQTTVTTPYTGFTGTNWPVLSNGWGYSATVGATNNRPDTYGATKTGQAAIICTISEGRCN